MSTSLDSRSEWVDYAKAIGIILVVYGHVARGLYNAGMEISEELYKLIDSIVYSFHMPLFFFLSGLFFINTFVKKGFGGLVFSKIDTIVYPFLLWSFFQGSIEVILSSYTNGSVSFLEVLTFWEPRAQFWFLYALFFVFLTACTLFSLSKNKHSMSFLVFSSMLYLWGVDYFDSKAISYVFQFLVFFIFGVFFAESSYFFSKIKRANIVLIFLLFVSAQYLFHIYLGYNYENRGFFSLLVALISIVFVVSLSMKFEKHPLKFIAYIGVSSMGIFLMHILAGSGIRIVLNKVFHVDSFLIHLIIGCCAGILLPLFAVKIVNKFKLKYFFSAPMSSLFLFLHNKFRT